MNIKFNFKSILALAIFIPFLFSLSCSNLTEKKAPNEKKEVEVTKKDKEDSPLKNPEDSLTKEDSKADVEKNNHHKNKTEKLAVKKACEEVNVGDNMVLKSQTFPIDFKPFEGSCFVTSHNAEYDDPPIGSEIAIYKDGKKVYKFDTRYHEDAATCWIEAVAFDDLNNDKLRDIIVVGKCGAKSGEIQGNEVFANNGQGFDTYTSANDALEDFKKIKDIKNFVKKNQKLFFK